MIAAILIQLLHIKNWEKISHVAIRFLDRMSQIEMCKRHILELRVRRYVNRSDNVKRGLRFIPAGEYDMGKARQVRKKKKQK